LHGFRAIHAAEEFLTTLQQTNSPEAFARSVEAYMYMAQHIYDSGMPTVATPTGTTKRTPIVKTPPIGPTGTIPPTAHTTSSSVAPTGSKYSVGTIFMKGGVKYKVIGFHANGDIETEVVK